MTLSVPTYLAASGIRHNTIRYEWDDWQTPPALRSPDPALVGQLRRLSERAVLGFACACAEWVVHRLAWLCNDAVAWSYLEAAWAMTVDVRYVGYGDRTGWQTFAFTGWDGPVRRPIRNTLNRVEIAFQQSAEGVRNDPPVHAAMISSTASYVMVDPSLFREWQVAVLERLQRLYPRDHDDPLGDVVPRQAFDPERIFDVSSTQALVDGFLRGLDYRSSMFLSTPEGLLEHFHGEADFIGVPYTFDIELDRKTREAQASRAHPHPPS